MITLSLCVCVPVQPSQTTVYLSYLAFHTQRLLVELSNKELRPPSQPSLLISLSPPLLFSVQWIQRRQRTLHYTVLCLPKSLLSKRSTDFVAALSSSPLQPLSCKWSWMLFSKECILKRNSHFCLCILSQTLFSPISSPLSRSLLPQTA